MTKKLPSREAQVRFAEAALEYRAAFTKVQQVLASIDLGRIPGWVFAIDRLDLEELQALSPRLREAEEHRRVWKVALHSLAELIALEDDGEAEPGDPPAEPRPVEPAASSVELGGGQDDAQLRKLDRFITVVNMAKAGGCIYVNGTFQPVSGRVASTDESFDEDGGRVPSVAHLELVTPTPAHRKPG